MKNKNTYIGDVIKRLRDEKGLTQEALADYSHISRKFMSKIEGDLSEPGLGTTFALAAALGMKASELIKEIEEHLDNCPGDESDHYFEIKRINTKEKRYDAFVGLLKS